VTIAVLVIVLAYMLGPVYWLIVSSTKSNSDLLTTSGWWFSGRNSFSTNYSALMSWTQGLFWRWILNSLLIALGAMAVVVALGTLASYALSRVRIPGRDALLYAMLLLSSIVTGTAAMVPTFQLMNLIGLINTRTGVILVLAGGLLPTVVFILKDFMDSVPKSYEESARLYGAGPGRVPAHAGIPAARPPTVLMYTFYTESGQADLRLISVFALVFALPVLAIYFVVNRKFGFRFYGGIKS